MLIIKIILADFRHKAADLRADYEKKLADSLEASQEIFERSSRSLWRCDPDVFEEDFNFLEITRLLQGHVENEKDLNRERTCTETCPNYQFTEEFGCSERSVCNRQPKCLGKLLFCITLEDDMWICPGNKKGSRRYEYIEYDNGRVLGDSKPCAGNGFSVRQKKISIFFNFEK